VRLTHPDSSFPPDAILDFVDFLDFLCTLCTLDPALPSPEPPRWQATGVVTFPSLACLALLGRLHSLIHLHSQLHLIRIW